MVRHQIKQRDAGAEFADAVTAAVAWIEAIGIDVPDEQLATRRSELDELAGHVFTLRQHVTDPSGDLINCCRLAGFALISVGKFAEGIDRLAAAVADAERVLGPDHPTALRCQKDLLRAYQKAGRLDEAIAGHRQVLADALRVLGADDHQAIGSRRSLANAYQRAGRLGEAIAEIRVAIADCLRVLGPDHPDTLTGRNNLAAAYQRAGRLADTLLSRNNLAMMRLGAGRADKVVPLLQRLLVDCKRVLGAKHPTTIKVRLNLAGARGMRVFRGKGRR